MSAMRDEVEQILRMLRRPVDQHPMRPTDMPQLQAQLAHSVKPGEQRFLFDDRQFLHERLQRINLPAALLRPTEHLLANGEQPLELRHQLLLASHQRHDFRFVQIAQRRRLVGGGAHLHETVGRHEMSQLRGEQLEPGVPQAAGNVNCLAAAGANAANLLNWNLTPITLVDMVLRTGKHVQLSVQ